MPEKSAKTDLNPDVTRPLSLSQSSRKAAITQPARPEVKD